MNQLEEANAEEKSAIAQVRYIVILLLCRFNRISIHQMAELFIQTRIGTYQLNTHQKKSPNVVNYGLVLIAKKKCGEDFKKREISQKNK